MSGLGSQVQACLLYALRNARRGLLRSVVTATGIAVATAFAATAAWVHQAADDVLGADARSSLGADLVWTMTVNPGEEGRLDALLSRPEVEAWSPALIGRSLVRSPKRASIVFVKGVVPGEFPFYGRSRLYGERGGLGPDEVALTRNAADRLGVGPGDTVEIHDGAANHRFRVAHVVPVYTEQTLDANIFGVAYVGLEQARALLRAPPGAVHQALIRGADPEALERLRAELEAAQPLSETSSALEEHRRLRAQVDNLMLFLHVFGAAAVLIASIGIANTVQMLVRGRVREIATLKAVGVRPRQVTLMVLAEAGLMGAAGVLGGLVFTLLFSGAATAWLGRFLQLDLAWQLHPLPLLVGGAVGLGAALLAAWLPAAQAARILPAVAWREDGGDDSARQLRVPLRERIRLLLLVGLLAGVYLHPLLGEGRADQPILRSLWVGEVVSFGGALALGLLARVSSFLLRIVGLGKHLARHTAYLALHNLGWGSRQHALTALCVTVSVLAVGLSGLMGPALKEGLRSQLSAQSGGNLFIVAPAAAEARVEAALGRFLPPDSVARTVSVEARLLTVAGRPAAEAQEAAVRRGATYLADPTFRLQGIDLAGRRPEYEVTAGRDLAADDAGKPVLLMLDEMAADLGVSVGDPVTLGLGEDQVTFRVVGLMKTELLKTAFMRTSVNLLEGSGQRSLSYTARVEPERVIDTMRALNEALPGEAYVLQIDDHLMAVTQTLDFQTAVLRIVSLLSTVAAVLLILNDVSLSVARRQRELAVMKVTGATPGKLLGAIAAQYGVIGIVGGLQGGFVAVVATAVIAGAILRTRVYVDVLYFATPLVTGLLAAGVAAVAALPDLSRRPDLVMRAG